MFVFITKYVFVLLMVASVWVLSEKVAVIGGGATGVFLSKFLTDKKHDVVVFEASGRIGGQVITLKRRKKRYTKARTNCG